MREGRLPTLATLCALVAVSFAAGLDDPSVTIIWPQSMIAGDKTLLWLHPASGLLPDSQLNITIRLLARSGAFESLYQQQSLTLALDVLPVELNLPMMYDGELSINVDVNCSGVASVQDANCRRQKLPIHPRNPLQSIGLRLEKNIYHPDDVVSIWLGAMDHHGRMEASGHQVHVSVRDPGNVTVKYWHHRLLWPGLTNFLFELSERPPSGMWTVHVTLVDTAYSAEQCHQRQASFAVLTDDHIDHFGDVDDAEASNSTVVYAAESHFVELNFSPRTTVNFQSGRPFAGELIASTSERGIVVGLDVLDQRGQSLHNQTLHFNQTSTVVFIVPAIHLQDNVTLQATLRSIEGQPLDNQFVLATHSLALKASQGAACPLQLFSRAGKYRFNEGDNVNVFVYSGCSVRRGRVHYVVTHQSGHVLSSGQEYWAGTTASAGLIELNLRVPVTYEMMPRSIITVFFDDDNGTLVAGSMDFQANENNPAKIEVMEMRGNAARINLTLNAGSYHCLYGSWREADDVDLITTSATWSTLDTNQSLYSLPKMHDTRDVTYQLGLFGNADIWMVECYEPSDFTWKDMNIIVPVVAWDDDGFQHQPVLRLVTVEPNGKMSNSRAELLTAKRIPWTVSFDLPPSVRVGEELIVDVTITNQMTNCSQTQLQMALSGGAFFVSNGKKYLQQPACLSPKSKSVYRVGVQINEPDTLSITVEVKGTNSVSCCVPKSAGDAVINLDVHEEVLETMPLTKTTRLLSQHFHHYHSENNLFCLQENMFVSNASSFEYKTLALASQKKSIVFQASSPADIHVVLGDDPLLGGVSHEIVLGGEDNMQAWISTRKNGIAEILSKIATPKLLRQDRLQTFWISWDRQKFATIVRAGKQKKKNRSVSPGGSLLMEDGGWLSVGKGSHIGSRVLISVPIENVHTHPLRFIAFATGWGFDGFFRVWGTSGTVEQSSRVVNIAKPQGSLASDEKAEITIRGGISASLDNLWATQSMQTAEPATLSALLEHFYRDQLRKVRTSQDEWNQLVQNMVAFRSADGSFHDGDETPSIKLTAVTIQALDTIKLQSYVDPWLLKSAFEWLHSVQHEDGSFACHVNASMPARISSTAFVLTCLSDIQHDDIVLYQLSSAAQRFMEKRLLSSTDDMTSMVAISTAVLVSHSQLWPAAVSQLDDVYDELLQCYQLERPGCLNLMVYALAAYFHQNQPDRYLYIVKELIVAPWKTLHSLDKIRAMNVWLKYGQVLNDPVRNLNIRLAFQSSNVTDAQLARGNITTFDEWEDSVEGIAGPVPVEYDADMVNDTVPISETRVDSLEELQHLRQHTPPLTYDVPSLPQNVEFSIAGTGCTILQTRVYWKTREPLVAENSRGELFSVGVSIVQDSIKETNEPPLVLTTVICVKWNGTDVTDLRADLEMFSSYMVSSVTSDDAMYSVKYRQRVDDVTIHLNQMQPISTRCVKVESQRRGLVRAIQPGRIRIYEKDQSQAHGHQWLFYGPTSNSTLFWASTTKSS